MAFPMPSKPSICMLRANSAFVSCKRGSATVTYCASSATTQQSHQQDQGILCDPCQGRGWLICDFCKGKKTNVKAQNNRIYRRCPTCRAVGYVLCTQCKVYKCVTFPDYTDGEL
ncbi:uncharacterized protein LOC116267855 isoform X4 [Nymphaea colorata]|uniref:uncharacterized protein LOC116267855 isoform X4 n=1 Tax=Nymphaea colorata TaxID=210225 RepID=UPI00129EA042|nr:uncharacterized protein LOC116267855 isoform X4 [Nymphaea colorata]